MKNNILISFVLSLLLFSPLLQPVNKILPVNKGDEKKQKEIILDTIEGNYDLPQLSGPVSNLPWRNDKDFLQAKKKNKSPLLMAAYCAVLKNPLPGEGYNVNLAGESIKSFLIKPSHVFSMNAEIGPYSGARGYREGASYSDGNIVMTEGGGVCKVATILYNLAVLSDLEIVERHHHSMPINYVPYGQDATVFYGAKDFKFKNTKNHNILIWSQMIDNRLYMAFYGGEKSPEIEWSHELSDQVDPPIKYIRNDNLEKGEMRTITSGLEGARVKSFITIKYPDGSIKMKNMGISNYRPLPQLIEVN